MKKEKVLSALMAATMACSMATPAFAASGQTQPLQASVDCQEMGNEYLSMKALDAESTAELQEEGYSLQEISEIRNFKETYDEHILNLANLDSEQLEGFGYQEDQIAIIKNFDPVTATEEDRARASAQPNPKCEITRYTGTTATVVSSFEWSGVPIFKMKDTFVTAWNNWQIVSRSCTPIKYVNIYDSSDTYKESTYSWEESDTGLTSFGVGVTFPEAQQDNYYYAKSGTCTYKITCASPQNLETIAQYGHKNGTVNLSLSIRGGLDVSFGTGYTVKKSIKQKAFYS